MVEKSGNNKELPPYQYEHFCINCICFDTVSISGRVLVLRLVPRPIFVSFGLKDPVLVLKAADLSLETLNVVSIK